MFWEVSEDKERGTTGSKDGWSEATAALKSEAII